MRSDARRHREELLQAATRVFQRHGLDVPLEAVLAETGLGRGTLYRHFNNRNGLIVAVLDHELERMAEFVDANIDDPALFVEFIRRQGLLALLVTPVFNGMEMERIEALIDPILDRANALNARVTEQAKRLGVIRPSFESTDLVLVIRMLGAASGGDPERSESELFERAVEIVLSGIARREA